MSRGRFAVVVAVVVAGAGGGGLEGNAMGDEGGSIFNSIKAEIDSLIQNKCISDKDRLRNPTRNKIGAVGLPYFSFGDGGEETRTASQLNATDNLGSLEVCAPISIESLFNEWSKPEALKKRIATYVA